MLQRFKRTSERLCILLAIGLICWWPCWSDLVPPSGGTRYPIGGIVTWVWLVLIYRDGPRLWRSILIAVQVALYLERMPLSHFLPWAYWAPVGAIGTVLYWIMMTDGFGSATPGRRTLVRNLSTGAGRGA